MVCPHGTIVNDLRQTDSASLRKAAIRRFTKALRRGDRFQQTWDAVGGAAGLARLMAQFSVDGVYRMCKGLGGTTSAEKARPERRKALGELVRLLYDESEDDRPLRDFYQNIVPACSIEVVEEWEQQRRVEWTNAQQKMLFFGHRERHENKFLDDIFSPGKELTFSAQRRLFCGNISFPDKILNTLLAKEGEIRVPKDFVDKLVIPLLRRLLKRRFDPETRQRYLHLFVQCIQKHQGLIAGQLNLWHRIGPFQYMINQWYEAPAGSKVKEQLESDLTQMIELIPHIESRKDGLRQFHSAVDVSAKLDHKARYELLRLLCLHTKKCRIDIDDGSDSGLARLKEVSAQQGPWPGNLFMALDPKKSLQLFERLDKAHPSSDFVGCVRKTITGTVIDQPQSPDNDSIADVEILRAVLIRRSKTEGEHEGWLERARTLVHERRTNSQQAREPGLRAFWAQSALNLCVAAGDIETLGDTVLWARRFTKDTLTCRDLYGPKVFLTRELRRLLSATPEGRVDTPELAAAHTSSVVKGNIEPANRILINLLETATMAVGEPGFQRSYWEEVLKLLWAVADRRTGNAKDLFKNLKKCETSESARCETEMVEAVWKPTIDMLIEAEAIVRNPTSDVLRGASPSAALVGSSRSFNASGFFVFKKLEDISISPPQLAYLARFLLDQMRARLGPEAMRLYMKRIVEVVESLAKSDQPALASPFIRDLILYDEGATESSAWHRQLLSVRFVSSLPAQAAKEMLQNMGGAMRDRLREQNQNPLKDETDKPSEVDGEAKPPTRGIKVTTVKMLAQLLEKTRFINVSSASDILIGLLAEARHIDIRTTITSSLISAMQEPTCPAHLSAHILDALERYIIPAAAGLNERRSLTEDDWAAAAEEGAPLPVVGEETPLLELLVEQAQAAKLKEEDRRRLAQLIMGALEQSAANNGRWMKLFLTKNKFALGDGEELPKIPVNLSRLSELFTELMPYMPLSVFDMVRSAVLTNLDPTPAVADVTRAIKASRDLVNSKPGKHWLAQFDNKGFHAFRLGVWSTTLALQKPGDEIQSKLEEGKQITRDTLDSFLFECAELLIRQGEYDLVERIVERLRDDRFKSRGHWDSWRDNCRPLVERIILKTEEVRVRQLNEKDGGRPPVLLPSSTRMAMVHLPLPFPGASAEEEAEFIAKLRQFTETLASRRQPYHNDFAHLRDDMKNWPGKDDFVHFALKLVDETGYDVASGEEAGRADYLCFELATQLLSKAEAPKKEKAIVEARELLDLWAGSRDERVRELGVKSRETLKGNSKGGWFMKDVSG